MHRLWLAVALLMFTTLGGCVSQPRVSATDADRAQVTARLKEFMNRYEQNDQAGVVALIDQREFLLLGDSVTERIQSADQLKAFMTRVFAMWKTARFSEIRDLDVRVGQDLATAYYLFSFTAAEGPTLPIRVVTTWRKDAGQWYLTQCANWVPEAR